METGTLADWSDLFAAEAGAAAALAGLLFVAVSINLARVLEFPQLPTRAIEALVALLSVLFISTVGLVPGQSDAAFGVETALIGVATWIAQTRSLAATHNASKGYGGYPIRVIMNQLPPLPFLLAGILLMLGHHDGIYWIVPGILLSFAAGVYDAWVLLVEIMR